MKVIVLVLFLLQSVLCLHINIDDSEGVDTVSCFQEQVPCTYVAYYRGVQFDKLRQLTGYYSCYGYL